LAPHRALALFDENAETPDMTMPLATTPPTTAAPRVSVVIPSYNHARYLAEAMDSVLAQQGVSLELIVIDDGSKDDSWRIIEEAAQRDPRIRAYRQANQGAHATINTGLGLGRGEFLAILNSDDRYSPGRLAKLVELADTGAGLDFIATGLRLIDADSQLVEQDVWLEEYRRMGDSAKASGDWIALLERNFTVSTSNFFLRRSLFEALGPIRPMRYNMDWDYAVRALLHGPERFVWRHDLVLLDYRMHGSNTILAGLPVSAIEANHILYGALKARYQVPGAALAGLRRHYRLIRHQQIAVMAAARDAVWDKELQAAHTGWAATRDAHDQTHRDLGQALTELGETRNNLAWVHNELAVAYQETAEIRASRSYRLGLTLTAPLRWWKDRKVVKPAPVANRGGSVSAAAQAAAPAPAGISAPAPAAAPLKPVFTPLTLILPTVESAPPTPAPRVAAHLHLHYVELLDELLDAVSHLPQPFDLFVTTTQPVEEIAARVQARFADARVWQCANQGKDVGPFIDALARYRLDEYDLVLKLHSKKSQNNANYLRAIRGLFGKDIRDGDDWRRKLIAPISGDAGRVARIYQAFAADPRLMMVGASRFICRAPDADPAAYARLCQRLEVSSEVLFFGGTMFWIRGQALGRILRAGFSLEDFDAAHSASVESTLEHGFERVFGAIAAAADGYLGGVPDLDA
jgi:glycosyltransferase involved in cell wall biosynthesis